MLDPNMIHPFVRVHIMDMNTCKYLAKKNPSAPGSYYNESCSLMDAKSTIVEKKVDFLLPVATKFFDMRIKGQNQCCWDEDFIFNEFASHILQPNVLILFEILECNSSLIAQNSKLINQELLYPVAWAYLRPLGTAHIHMSRTRL